MQVFDSKYVNILRVIYTSVPRSLVWLGIALCWWRSFDCKHHAVQASVVSISLPFPSHFAIDKAKYKQQLEKSLPLKVLKSIQTFPNECICNVAFEPQVNSNNMDTSRNAPSGQQNNCHGLSWIISSAG